MRWQDFNPKVTYVMVMTDVYSHLNSPKRHCVSSRWVGHADEFESVEFDPVHFGPLEFAVIIFPRDTSLGQVILGHRRLNDTSFVFRLHNSDHGGEIEQKYIKIVPNLPEAYEFSAKITRLKALK